MDSGESFDVAVARSRRGKRPDAKLFDDVEIVERPEEETAAPAPEPLKRVKVLDPFLVSHEGTPYWPGDVPEVPESVAAWWITQRWVIDAGDE